MRAFWSDPYLWLHLAGFATVPLWLEICLLGLAVGDPVLPVWMEVLLVGTVGIAPILWMQWQKPFCIYSFLFLAVAPVHMTDRQRRLLRLFKTSTTQLLAIPVAVALLVILWKLYLWAPLVASVAPFDGQRWFGLGLAAIAFLFANLFTQVPVSVLRVLLASDAQVNGQEPYPSERIGQDFTLPGFRLKQILPLPATETIPAGGVATSGVPTASPTAAPVSPPPKENPPVPPADTHESSPSSPVPVEPPSSPSAAEPSTLEKSHEDVEAPLAPGETETASLEPVTQTVDSDSEASVPVTNDTEALPGTLPVNETPAQS